jgi:hypothetical protein
MQETRGVALDEVYILVPEEPATKDERGYLLDSIKEETKNHSIR